jgi:ubiquinone biosynthesis monooxygenase Coq7
VTRAPTVAIGARLRKGEPLANRILRVDHGGEHGAVSIYKAQALICAWRAPALVAGLKEFQMHEEHHRRAFAEALRERGVRQGLGYRFCAIGGFVLGAVTALIGPAAVAATTHAVERVVFRHLGEQLDYLRTNDEGAYAIVQSILADEQAHHDHAGVAAKQGRFWPAIVEPVVVAATEAVIWIGMHR